MIGAYEIHQLFDSTLSDPALIEDRAGAVTLIAHQDPQPSGAKVYWRRADLMRRYPLTADAMGKPLLTKEACMQLRQEALRQEGMIPPLEMTCLMPHYS